MSVFHHFLKIFLVLSPFLLDPDPYQSSPWIRIRNEFFHILDPDPYQNDTDPQHWLLVQIWIGIRKMATQTIVFFINPLAFLILCVNIIMATVYWLFCMKAISFN